MALCLISEVPYPDAPAEVADLLVRTEGVTWAACIAPFEDSIQISVRANDPNATAGRILAAMLPSGGVGGHDTTAAGRVARGDRDWASASCDLALQLLRAIGRTGLDRSWLVPRRRANEPDTREASLLLEHLPLAAPEAVGLVK